MKNVVMLIFFQKNVPKKKQFRHFFCFQYRKQMETKKMPKNAKIFDCMACDFVCSKQSNYTKHLRTRKHKINGHFHEMELFGNKKNAENAADGHACEWCAKIYKTRGGRWKHQKKCPSQTLIPLPTIDPTDDKIITILMKENTDFKNIILNVVQSNSQLQQQCTNLQQQVLDVCKQFNSNQTTTINSHNNSHNKTFNLQFFLNETCKDAMNIMDFVDSFTLQLSDLEDVSKQGYVDGISGIIMKKLNEMDVHKRPIHCSDAKREIMYVKDQNKWEKEDLGYTKLRKAIKYISKKNSDLLGQWSEAHPASKNITTQTNTEYMQMIVQAMGGRGEITENESKIIKKIAKTVLIAKD
jgi:hypothetical protein